MAELLPHHRQKPGRLLSTVQCPGGPHSEDFLAQDVSGAEVRDSALLSTGGSSMRMMEATLVDS